MTVSDLLEQLVTGLIMPLSLLQVAYRVWGGGGEGEVRLISASVLVILKFKFTFMSGQELFFAFET